MGELDWYLAVAVLSLTVCVGVGTDPEDEREGVGALSVNDTVPEAASADNDIERLLSPVSERDPSLERVSLNGCTSLGLFKVSFSPGRSNRRVAVGSSEADCDHSLVDDGQLLLTLEDHSLLPVMDSSLLPVALYASV